MDKFFSKIQRGFRKGYSMQQCLLALIENGSLWLIKLSFAVLVADFSKDFDCLLHELLITKLHSYRFSPNTQGLIHRYLSNERQST